MTEQSRAHNLLEVRLRVEMGQGQPCHGYSRKISTPAGKSARQKQYPLPGHARKYRLRNGQSRIGIVPMPDEVIAVGQVCAGSITGSRTVDDIARNIGTANTTQYRQVGLLQGNPGAPFPCVELAALDNLRIIADQVEQGEVHTGESPSISRSMANYFNARATHQPVIPMIFLARHRMPSGVRLSLPIRTAFSKPRKFLAWDR